MVGRTLTNKTGGFHLRADTAVHHPKLRITGARLFAPHCRRSLRFTFPSFRVATVRCRLVFCFLIIRFDSERSLRHLLPTRYRYRTSKPIAQPVVAKRRSKWSSWRTFTPSCRSRSCCWRPRRWSRAWGCRSSTGRYRCTCRPPPKPCGPSCWSRWSWRRKSLKVTTTLAARIRISANNAPVDKVQKFSRKLKPLKNVKIKNIDIL